MGLVVVSHSRALAEAAVALAEEMLHEVRVPIAIAAGLADGAFGTDAVAIHEAIADADEGAGVVVLMDLGSALLSAELALDLLDDAARSRVLLSAGPLVEGLVVAVVTAASGAPRDRVASDASDALTAKQRHFGDESPSTAAAPDAAPTGSVTGRFTVTPQHGLHARPAALLVQEVAGIDAVIDLRNLTTGSDWVPANSMLYVTTLGAEHGHEVEVRAVGPQAAAGVERLLALALRDFASTR